jgi:superfamily II DNA or RNA helicase
MSYFEDHYNDFNYPIGTDESAGFRNAQVGAIHAAAAHFTVRSDPGIVTMPTGSGKTAVLLATAFVLRAKRVLILTPSRLVREQIVDEALDLTRLRELGALPRDIPRPHVMNVRKRIASAEQWEEMQGYDVVVATSAGSVRYFV